MMQGRNPINVNNFSRRNQWQRRWSFWSFSVRFAAQGSQLVPVARPPRGVAVVVAELVDEVRMPDVD